MDNILSLIGLMKRAGKLKTGAEDACDAAKKHKAKILLLAADTAENAANDVERASSEAGITLIKLEYTKQELGHALGQKECAALALLDSGLAASLCTRLGLTTESEKFKPRKAGTNERSAAGAAKKRGNA